MLDELRTMDWVPRLVRSKASKLNEAIKRSKFAWDAHQLSRNWPSKCRFCAEMEKLILDANAVNLISLNKKWYETDSL